MTRGIIATPHRQATEVGAQILRDGGNAIDAAVAANAVLCVVYPHMTSLGGDLFALVWPAGEEEPVGLEGAGPAGARASVESVRDQGHDVMPARGALTVTVPGTVQAWGRLIERFGTLGFQALLDPAANIARDGFAATEDLAQALVAQAGWLTAEREAAELFPPVKAGMTLRNPDLAATLTRIGRGGFFDFYRGSIAAAMARAVRDRGGLITETDLANFRSAWVEPLTMRWGDLTLYEMPPPTQGLVVFGMLARLERSETNPELDASMALQIKSLRDAVYPLRDRYITDPQFAEVPHEPFLDPLWNEAGAAASLAEADTIYLCAADEEGNVISLIQSVAYPFGSGVIPEGTGFLLHNRGAYFSLDPTHANRIQPGKRTMHTLIPSLARRGDERWAFGTMGADGQPQIQLQVLLNLTRTHDPAEAVALPRVRVGSGGKTLFVEADYPGAAELSRRQPEVVLKPPRQSMFGHAAALTASRSGWAAGADPRSDGSVAEV